MAVRQAESVLQGWPDRIPQSSAREPGSILADRDISLPAVNKIAKLLIPVNTLYAQYVVSKICMLPSLFHESKLQPRVGWALGGGGTKQRQNVDKGRGDFVAFRQHHAMITECWELFWEARHSLISVQLFVDRLVRFLQAWNTQMDGVLGMLEEVNG